MLSDKEFSDLLLPALDRLLPYALRLTRDATAAEDLIQDAAVKAWRYRASYDAETSSIRGWLAQTIRRCWISKAEKSSRRSGMLAAYAEGHLVSAWTLAHGEDMSPEDGAVASTREEAVQLALTKLRATNPEQAKTLELRMWEDMSCREIAEQLEVSEGTVMSRLFRARRDMREELVAC